MNNEVNLRISLVEAIVINPIPELENWKLIRMEIYAVDSDFRIEMNSWWIPPWVDVRVLEENLNVGMRV